MKKRFSNEQNKLRSKIAMLQLKKLEQESSIKKQFSTISKGFKPSAIISNTISGLYEKSNLTKTTFTTLFSIATGLLSKRLIVGKSSSIFRTILGHITQLATTKMVAKKI